MDATRNAGSFRDPSGHVFHQDGRVFRTVSQSARSDYEAIRDKGIFERLGAAGKIVGTAELPRSEWPEVPGEPAHLLEHERVPYITYPYEWPFAALKEAALHHLDLQLEVFEAGVVLSDASAYNVQFIGTRPVFIDVLSFRPYREGEYWAGHRQFCEQFLNPLLLWSELGVAPNAWYRGRLEGIATSDLARLLPWRSRLSWNILSQIMLQASLEQKALREPDEAVRRANRSSLSRAAYTGILSQLRSWIARLKPAGTGDTAWSDYADHNTYSTEEREKKRAVVSAFAGKLKPETLIDVGCNTGDFALTALKAGAARAVGFDFDHASLNAAFRRSHDQSLDFLPLWLDAANPSPDQGWMQNERQSFNRRFRAGAMIALAFEHHLTVAKNTPMDQTLDWLVSIAPAGIIEFVPKSDPTVQRMLALREDVFPDYDEQTFVRLLSDRAAIVEKTTVSGSGRLLVEYRRQ